MNEHRVDPAGKPDKPAAISPRRPYHVGVAIGLSAGLYAGSLAAVTILQIDQDRTLIADRQPVGDAIDILVRHDDQMASSLDQAAARFEAASQSFGGVSGAVDDLHASVAQLGRTVAAIDRMALEGAKGLRLPPVPSVRRYVPGTVPHAAPTPKPPPPPTHGGSGGSGKP